VSGDNRGRVRRLAGQTPTASGPPCPHCNGTGIKTYDPAKALDRRERLLALLAATRERKSLLAVEGGTLGNGKANGHVRTNGHDQEGTGP
jgi:hypothetical protein